LRYYRKDSADAKWAQIRVSLYAQDIAKFKGGDVGHPSDKQWYIAIDDVRFRFHPAVGARLLIGIPPASQYGSHGERTE
jgi:hypothetical protein